MGYFKWKAQKHRDYIVVLKPGKVKLTVICDQSGKKTSCTITVKKASKPKDDTDTEDNTNDSRADDDEEDW